MTNKNVAAVRLVERDEAAQVVELPEELRVSLAQIAGVAREGLLAMSATVGLVVMHEMMGAEMTAKVGAPKHAKLVDRTANWHGDAPGSVVLGGRRVPIDRPRGRPMTKRSKLGTYAQFTNDDLLLELLVAPGQREARRDRERARERKLHRAHRERRPLHLARGDRIGQSLQLELADRPQRHLAPIPDQHPHDVGYEYLPATCGSAQTRRLDDRRAEPVVVLECGFTDRDAGAERER